MTIEWNGFKAGDRIVMLIETMGDSPLGEEIAYPAGAAAVVDLVEDFGPLCRGAHIIIGDAEADRGIVNVFDDNDIARLGGLLPFRKAE